MDATKVHHHIDQFLLDRGLTEAAGVPAAGTLDELGIDSLSLVDLLFELEREFGVEIADEDVPDIRTIGDLVDHVTDAQAR